MSNLIPALSVYTNATYTTNTKLNSNTYTNSNTTTRKLILLQLSYNKMLIKF